MLIVQIILYVVLLTYVGYVIYFIVGWLRTKNQTNSSPSRFPQVSVIVPVRNEGKFIGNLLNDLNLQNYPKDKFDIIVIDDYSTDNTVEIIKQLNFSNVKVVPLHIEGETVAYKKKAITTGVENSNAELIVTTDGDCRMGPNWLSAIVSFYSKTNFKLISSPVAFHEERNWYEKVQTVEFQYLIGVGASCIRNGMPSTCNGANLAYTKELFTEIHGFEGIDDIAFGDDELLLHKIYKRYPEGIGFNKNYDATVYTYAKENLKDFIEQRKRWAKKSANYFDNRLMVMVTTVFLVNAILLLSVPFAFFYSEIKQFLLIAIPLKALFDGIFMYLLLHYFKKDRFIFYAPIVLFLYVFYFVYLAIIGNIGSTYQWKGRKVI